jgi:HEAT repeat protein
MYLRSPCTLHTPGPTDFKIMRKPDSFSINAKVAATLLLLIAFGFTQNSGSQAQQTKGGPITVSSVSSRASANGTVVSIAADGPLNRAQTWQDREGYHVVVPSAGTQNAIKVARGIKVRQLDRSLEIVIQTKPGASVTVQPMANRLNLNVEGKLDPRGSTEADNANAKSEKTRQSDDLEAGQQDDKSARLNKTTGAESASAKNGGFVDRGQTSPEYSGPAANSPAAADSTQGQPVMATEESSVVSGATILIVLSLVFLGLFVLRRRRASQTTTAVMDDDNGFETFDGFGSPQAKAKGPGKDGKISGVGDHLMKLNGSESNGASAQRKLARMPVAMPTSLYGAYQADLEIGKLVQGQPHKMDVVASRAPDDRRAIEASLLKTITSPAADEDLRRRARGALEEYGFVARQSAALLMASDPYERTSAARMLGEVKSPAALPFLLEALYDHESLVRNQAVLSIGELRLPSAIGALLDIARKHPDVPGSLLSRALSACSVEGLDFFDAGVPEPRLLSGVNARVLAEEIMTLEPAAVIEELPESADDEKLVQAFAQVQSEDLSERSDAIKVLAQFSVQSSVAALAKVARLDQEASLRALAISSLAFINHESVFPAILIAMADESREVRAAAARSLSRLSFDRADAYIRVTETHDVESLRYVAEACIKAGIAMQGIDRMSSGDHQAYEAMSVVSLLVKANAFEPLLEVIANHPNIEVRLIAIYVIALAGQPAMLEPLRQLLVDCAHEAVQEALEVAIARLDAPGNAEPSKSDCEPEATSDDESEVQQVVADPEVQRLCEVGAQSDPEEEAQSELAFVEPSESETEMHPDSEVPAE